MQPVWCIEMLGCLRAAPARTTGRSEGLHVISRFRSRKGAALLAYLAYHSRYPHPRELLIELLWPDAPKQAGRTSLRTELCWLRRQLEPRGVPAGAVLLTEGDTVRLNPAACSTDVAAFEAALRSAAEAGTGAQRSRRLVEAVDRYRGELLPGLFEAWVVPERLRLLEAFLDAVDELVREREAAGDRAGALRWAWRAAGVDPLREMAGAESGAPLLPSAAHPADRERSLRQQLHARTAEVEELRRQLSAQTEAAATLRRRLAVERAAVRKLQQELAARAAEAEAPRRQLAPHPRRK